MRSSFLLVTAVAALLVLCCLPGSAQKIPDYITPCRKNDPNLNACALKNGRAALPSVVKGDKKFGIPVLDPLKLEKIVVDEKSGALGLGITATEIKISGLKDATLDDIKVDLKNRLLEITVTVPVLQSTAAYEVAGKILVLPIKGDGTANITVTQMTATYKYEYNLEKHPEGYVYEKIINPSLTYVINGQMYFTLTNLFNGDKLLGNAMNEFLNENWRDVEKEMGPAISNVLSDVITNLLQRIYYEMSYDNAFPETV